MKNKLWLILLGILFIKGLVWMVLTPIFQVPDEPSHFSIVQFLAVNGRRPHPRREQPTSKEVFEVSRIVNFNWEIIHPVWRGYQPDWWAQLGTIVPEASREFVRNKLLTSLKRPPLYYFLAAPFYWIFESQPFIYRFYSVRFFSLITSLAIVYFSYKAAKVVFKSNYLALAAAALVGFQPTLSFIGVGIHYDSLAILISTLFTYLMLKFIETKHSKFFKLGLFAVLLGLLTKPELFALVLTLFLFMSKKQIKLVLPLGLTFIIFLALIFPKILLLDQVLYMFSLNDFSAKARSLVNLTFSVFSGKIFNEIADYLAITLKPNLAQVLPWYWGVFGWLEKTLPLFVYQIIKAGMLLCLAGYLKAIWLREKLSSREGKSLVFLAGMVFFNVALIILNDFTTYFESKEIFGFQGRYLLPAIASHMILLVFGLSRLVSEKRHAFLAGVIIVSAVGLNLVGLQSLYQYFGWVW